MAVNFIDPNPSLGNQFGHSVVPLTNGNVVITAPLDDAGGVNAGAVYLFNGTTGALISTLRGSSNLDNVGLNGVIPLANGNFVVSSANWHLGGSAGPAVGAVTWGSGTTGVEGVVSAGNSLIGSTDGDGLGAPSSVVALPSGNYVVTSSGWDNGLLTDVGAVTWVDGTVGLQGTVSAANSLIGTTANDRVGRNGIQVLSSGNFVVVSPQWNNGSATAAGAVTWVSGTVGLIGSVSTVNSLVGARTDDSVGNFGISKLSNGNFVVVSPDWDNGTTLDAGAATWASGTAPTTGIVSVANSLIGSTASDRIGRSGVVALTNGNYVVTSPDWDRGGIVNAGATTWGNGNTGTSGIISIANSLVGERAEDMVGLNQVVPLANGNYVVTSALWDNGAIGNAGAATWGSGTAGVTGFIGSTNSLVGTSANDTVGSSGVKALANGNYVVPSPSWDQGLLTDIGAVTWGNGSTGLSGEVSVANSLTGSQIGDSIGLAITPLANGNYVVSSQAWDFGAIANVGAVTWRDGSTPTSGTVNELNSLIGSSSGDLVGSVGSVRVLSNGNYVVTTSSWNHGAVSDVGAVTWGSGLGGVAGAISPANSLIGSTASDMVGSNGIVELASGNYLIRSANWDNGSAANAGAVTYASSTGSITGVVSAANSLVGSTASDLFGSEVIRTFSNGNFVIVSSRYDLPGIVDAGSVTWGDGSSGIVGTVSTNAEQSVVGTTTLALQSVVSNDATGTFIVRFTGTGAGRVQVGWQATGFVEPIPPTLSASLVSGNLTITDTDATGKDNTLSVALVNLSGVDYLEFTDAAQAFDTPPATTPASTLSSSNRRLRVPLSAVTGSLTLNLAGGSDAVTLNLASGDVIPAGGLVLTAGEPTTASADRLLINGGNQGTTTYNYTTASSGNVVLGSFGTVTYSGLESLVNSGTTTDSILNLPTGLNSVSLSDDSSPANGLSRVSGSTLVTTDFANPIGSFAMNRGSATDSVALAALPDLTASLLLGTSLLPLGTIDFSGAITLAVNKNLIAYAAGNITFPTAASDIATTGSGEILLTAGQKIALAAGSSLQSAGGNIALTAAQPTTTTAGNFHAIDVNGGVIASTAGSVQLTADSLSLAGAAVISAIAGSVNVAPRTAGFAIDLGSADSTTALGITDVELDLVTAGTIVIGSSSSGALTVSGDISRSAATSLAMQSAAAIQFTTGSLNSAGGSVLLNPGTSISPATSGVDISTGAGTLGFGSGDDLALAINGTTADLQYQRLNVAGLLNLNGLDLVITGTAPALSDNFIIVSNDGSHPISGTFNGLAEGSLVSVNGVTKRITYLGGDGNDVALLANSLPTITAIGAVNINEDALQQTIPLTGLSSGTESQAFAVTATSDNVTLLPTLTVNHSANSATGNLQFTPAPNASGSATITVTVRDVGFDDVPQTADDGVTTTFFSVNVAAVNDVPVFTKGNDFTLPYGSSTQTVNGWATGISAGPADEASQEITFQITTNTDATLFSVQPAVASNGRLTFTPAGGKFGSATITLVAFDGIDSSAAQSFVITVDPPPPTFVVSSFTATSTGAVIEFIRDLDVAALNLYYTQAGGSGPADVSFVGATTGTISGSLLVDANLRRVTFVATSGTLPADQYTVTLRSAGDGFRDSEQALLDGDSNGTAGGDFVRMFTVAAVPANAVTIRIPSFARGPLQAVNVPASATSGLPISFSNGGGITSANFEIRYNPAILNLTGATVASGLPVGAAVNINTSTPGVALVQFTSPTPLAEGTTHFLDLQTMVPATAPYLQKQVLDIANISLNGGSIPGLDDDGVHVAAYFGDVTGNGTLSAQDAARVARMAVGYDNGFQSYKLLDPTIVGDISGNGSISSLDTNYVLQVAVAIAVPEIPALPTTALSLLSGGPDPKLSIPTTLAATAGDSLIVPVLIDSIVDLTGNGLESADLAIYYDPTVLEITSVTAGELLGSNWTIATRIDPIAGRIFISTAGSQPLEGSFVGEFLKLHTNVKSTAAGGASPINLAASSHDPARATQLNEGFLTLIPAPTDAANDVGVDGLLTVTPGPASLQSPPATATVDAGKLQIVGTPGKDFIYISARSATEVRVRVNSRILGDFPTPSEIQIDSLGGDDYIYVDQSLPQPGAAAVQNSSAGEFVDDAGIPPVQVVSPAVEPAHSTTNPPPAANDLALLQLLWNWGNDAEDGPLAGTANRRRR
ncbi:Cohesin domain protein [Anatilimnocola aggregata]|uniref:Cohesin domain protein n=2 Tax=Anatilimnocola aggregata TaxID=2528021 RepID=A0A517YIC5_9BACT|nr:Cohesin domain protein [Anatilimnocola aggregata]